MRKSITINGTPNAEDLDALVSEHGPGRPADAIIATCTICGEKFSGVSSEQILEMMRQHDGDAHDYYDDPVVMAVTMNLDERR